MAKKKPAAAGILGATATPGYWDKELDLIPPNTVPGDQGDVGGALHQSPAVGGPGPVKGETGPAAGGGSAGGGSSAGTDPGEVPLDDWDNQLIAIGMPPALVSAVKQYFSAHKDDPDVFAKVKEIVRGSDWWKQTFPGFWEGASSGLFQDETGYRNWYKSANDAFKRYYGKDMTANDAVGYLHNGFSPNTIEQIGAGHAYVEANRPDIQWAEGAFDRGQLSEADLQAYGEQQSGRQSDLGTRIQQRVNAAVAKAQRVFEGTLASPNLQLGSQGLAAPSLNPQQKPDVQA